MTKQEIENIADKAKVISSLDVVGFLKNIKAKAEVWKEKLNARS